MCTSTIDKLSLFAFFSLICNAILAVQGAPTLETLPNSKSTGNNVAYRRFIRRRPSEYRNDLYMEQIVEVFNVRRRPPAYLLSDDDVDRIIRCDFDPTLKECKALSTPPLPLRPPYKPTRPSVIRTTTSRYDDEDDMDRKIRCDFDPSRKECEDLIKMPPTTPRTTLAQRPTSTTISSSTIWPIWPQTTKRSNNIVPTTLRTTTLRPTPTTFSSSSTTWATLPQTTKISYITTTAAPQKNTTPFLAWPSINFWNSGTTTIASTTSTTEDLPFLPDLSESVEETTTTTVPNLESPIENVDFENENEEKEDEDDYIENDDLDDEDTEAEETEDGTYDENYD